MNNVSNVCIFFYLYLKISQRYFSIQDLKILFIAKHQRMLRVIKCAINVKLSAYEMCQRIQYNRTKEFFIYIQLFKFFKTVLHPTQLDSEVTDLLNSFLLHEYLIWTYWRLGYIHLKYFKDSKILSVSKRSYS